MADWIITTEASELSGYSEQYIRRLIRQKKLKAEKKGGRHWVDKQSLLDYMKAAKESDDKRQGPRPTD
jgi:excisionase family DNA binding protein